MRARLTCLAILGTLLWQGVISGAEAYVLRFRTDAQYRGPPCRLVGWEDELLFRNITASDLTVRNLATTVGAAHPPGQLVIPAGRTVSTLGGESLNELGGDPFGFQLLVNRIDVPEGIVLASRADVYGPASACDLPAGGVYHFGSLPLPIFRSLTPSNQPQVHLPVDMGIQRRHTNVIIYNAGTVAASASIEIHMGCNESLLQSVSVSIAPDAVSEVGGLGLTDDPLGNGCSGGGFTTAFTRYLVVTVDQPSFSHVLTVSDEFATPTIGVTSP